MAEILSQNTLAMEKVLRDDFVDMVDALKLPDILHVLPDRNAPRNLDDYRLTPITPSKKFDMASSMTEAAYAATLAVGVVTNYRYEGGPPYIDTSYAVGLVFNDELSAVASAGIIGAGILRIKQVQAVSGHTGEARYHSGLFGGFDWRATLVEAWRELAPDIGASALQIQGSRNNPWRRKMTGIKNVDIKTEIAAEQQRFDVAYDGLAKRLGFTYDKKTGNWSEPVKARQT